MPASTMVTIDHTAFPSIMDSIIQHAPVQTLFKLRLTSKSFLTHIDTSVGRHALLSISVTGDWLAMHLPKEYRFSPGPASWELTTPVPSVRVLDIDDHILGRPDKPDVLHLFTGVSTLRRFHAPGEHERLYPLPPTSATTVVDYVPHSVLTPDFHLPGARRHIVHVAVSVGDEGGPPTCIYNSALDQPLVDHLVIVLWPDWEGPDHDLTAGALARVLIFVANLMFPKVGHLTVVGLEPSACAQSTAPLNSIPRTWSERFKFMLTPYISMNKVEATYLTMTEWLNELDEDERDIIAVWPSRSDDIFPTWRAAA